jgi:hypothetical protein
MEGISNKIRELGGLWFSFSFESGGWRFRVLCNLVYNVGLCWFSRTWFRAV